MGSWERVPGPWRPRQGARGHERALPIYERKCGSDSAEVAGLLNDLGNTYRASATTPNSAKCWNARLFENERGARQPGSGRHAE